VGKGRFDDEKTEKGRKKAAIRGQVPRKQGLKPYNRQAICTQHTQIRGQVPRKQGLKRTEKVMPPIERPLSEGKFQENKD